MQKFIRIFKAGTHRDSLGREHSYTVEDLDRMVTTYNDQPEDTRRQAPLVYGHPKDNAPAHGWVGELKREGEYLLAKCVDMKNDFVESVNNGSYKFRSASFYPSGLLRHVGFLGAVQPAVAGLGEVSFADEGEYTSFEDFMSYDTAWSFRRLGDLFQSIRDWFIEQNGIEQADKLTPQYIIDDLKTVQGTEPEGAAYNENPSNPSLKDNDMELKEQLETLTRDFAQVKSERDDLKAKADAQEQQIAALTQNVEKLAAQSVRREMENYCDGLIKAGKMLAGEREFFVNDLVQKAAQPTADFAEGQSPLDQTKAMLEARPAHKLFQEHATPQTAASAPTSGSRQLAKNVEFSESDSELDAKVRQLAAEKNISYTEALDLISEEL